MLVAAYHSAGNLGKAIAELRKAAEIDPSVKEQADSLIESIRKGTLPR